MNQGNFTAPPPFAEENNQSNENVQQNVEQQTTEMQTEESAQESQEKKTKSSPKTLTHEDRQYLINNYKTMSNKALAEKLGVQPPRIYNEVKKVKSEARKKVIEIEKQNGQDAYSTTVNEKGQNVWDFESPLTQAAKNTEERLANYFEKQASASSGGGGSKKGSSSKQQESVNSIVNDMLKDITGNE